MIVKEIDNNIVISKLSDFNLEETLECGQCFDFIKAEENAYDIIACGRYLFAEQKEDTLILYDTSMDEYESVWKDYFDFETDYADIKRRIIDIDERLKSVIEENSGIHILRQDFYETLISFIISQNKQIPQIKQVIRNISERFGREILTKKGAKMYLFPTLEEIKAATEEDFKSCKAGFRAKYLIDAIKKLSDKSVCEEKLFDMTDAEVHDILVSIKGVGDKVASCVMLFGLYRVGAFPVDVWMKRIMEYMYFGEDTKKEVIESYAKDKFKELSGYAQQYLFIYGKNERIGR